ncbi:MAG TPA: TolC family protein [Gemmatimonadaceae bacterium]|nr:TolC family protein [Gemmatimonadaceae bacterium]
MSRRRLLRLPLVATLAVAGAARAQADARPSGGLTLSDVVRVTLAGGSRIRYDAQEVESWKGRVMASSAPFDPRLRTAVTSSRDNQRFALGAAPVWAVQQDVGYEAGVEKEFRSGIVVSPGVGVTRSATSLAADIPTGSATAGVRVRVPLMQNRGGSVSATAERVAELDYRGNVEDLRHTVATSLRDAAIAFWSYVGARRRLDVLTTAEARAKRLADETEQLVRADERPAGDMRQLLANLATKRAARIQAEQALVQARFAVAEEMGLRPALAARLPDPATDFPVPPEEADTTEAAAARAAAAVVERLTTAALARRADLAAAREKGEASRVELGEFRSAARPRLDVTVGVGYTGLESGPGVGRLFTPLYRNVPGLNASVQVSYELPALNAAGRGRVAQGEAFLEQQAIGRELIERQIGAGVATAAEGLRRSRQALRESQTAVALYRETVDNEKRKFQLGMSTLFDVIAAEDALTNAMLGEIASQHAYAAAIASLRFEAGALAAHDPAGLLTPP